MGNNPKLYGYEGDTNGWVDVFGLECGTATIHKYDGDANNPFGHYSIEINNKGNITHTHQVITSRDLSSTTVVPAKGMIPSKSVTIDIPDATSASVFQNESIGKELGAYDVKTNSCVDHVSDVLRAGGVDVPESAMGQYKYLKKVGF